MSRPYAEVIGDPIAHSKSPLIHNFWLEKLGIDAEYRACHIRPDELSDYFSVRRADPDWCGCNVTIPHKEAVVSQVDEVVPDWARRLGAVNTVFHHPDGRLLATNTDIDGIGEAVPIGSLPPGPVTVIGAGGAARAAFAFLAREKAGPVRILARSRDKARQAAEQCGLKAEVLPFVAGTRAFSGSALVINATQLGMTGQDQMPDFVLEELRFVHRKALVFDMVYTPLETRLLLAAKDRRLRTVDGLTMLIEQAKLAFAVFFRTGHPFGFDAELRALLMS